ncbi:MAG: aminotransferase class V-fold PLP-dependent enzyme [Gemmatimonadaceae bacterium]|nr:aminotransferase class V-fold PLP-dependent enzyme [Gemmatimonadaceae bacterium]
MSEGAVADGALPEGQRRAERLTCQRERFSLPPEAHYLNCAYAGPLMQRVEHAALAALQRLRTPYVLHADDFFRDAEHVRALFAALVHAPDPASVAIVPSVSYGISIAARNTPLAPGRNVVVAEGQFPSNVYPWRRACSDVGATLRTVPRPAARDGRVAAAWSERLIDAIDRHTAAVALGTIDWTDGTLFDLEAIGARAREVGAAFVLDGIQSVGALPIDVAALRPDALVCASYKWLLGPMGVGVAYFSERFACGVPLEETWLGRQGSEAFHRLTEYREAYQDGARRLDAGGRAQFVLLPMLIAALMQLNEWGPDRIQRYCADLAQPFLGELADAGFETSPPGETAAHLFALRAAGTVDVAELQRALERQHVHVSLRGPVLRVSPNVYNTPDDLAALVEVLRRHGRGRARPLRPAAGQTPEVERAAS